MKIITVDNPNEEIIEDDSDDSDAKTEVSPLLLVL